MINVDERCHLLTLFAALYCSLHIHGTEVMAPVKTKQLGGAATACAHILRLVSSVMSLNSFGIEGLQFRRVADITGCEIWGLD